MPDEPVTTQEPVVDVNDPGTVPPAEPDPPPAEPQLMTPDQVAEIVARQTNDTKTWIGRRDKELLGQIGSIIDERLNKKPENPEELSSRLLEDPVSTITEIVHQTRSQETAAEQRHASDTFTQLGMMMDSDKLYQDKELGSELVEEVKKQFQQGKIDTSLSPEAAAKVLHADALSNVMRNRQGANPLSKNTPTTSVGTLSPGVPNTQPKIKTPDLSPENKAFAAKWGFKDEDLARIFSGGSNPNHGPKG